MDKNTPLVIRVEHLAKKYEIGQKQPYHSLRETLTEFVNNLFQKNILSKNTKKNEFWALKNISFDIHQGEVVGIVGRNGAGKSTLLKILSRITPPTEGSVAIRGRIGSLLEVGTGFHPELSGRENIFLNGAILGMTRKEIEQQYDEIVSFAEIEKFIDTPVKHYSSGMYVRLAFSVASHLNPEILLVDEVLAVGDVVFQKKCLDKMRDVAQGGRTVIFVSHNIGLVRSLCQRVILIDEGKMIADGETNEVLEKYLDLSTKNEIGPTKTYPKKKIADGQFISITLLNKSNKPTTRIKLGENSTALVKYKIYRDLINSDVGIMISQGGQIIWIGLDNDANKQLLLKRKAGNYTQVIQLPTKYLMPGYYHLGPSMGFVGTGAIDNHYFDGLNFEITNIPQNSKQRVQSLQKGGLIAYIKPWKKI